MKEELEQKEMDYVCGRTAGSDVFDRSGNKIVARGETIDDGVVDVAWQNGLLHALMLSAVSAIVGATGEEARRRLQEFRDISENHEAEFVRDQTAACDVLDAHGFVIIREGERVTNNIINKARDAGLLQELVLAVGAPGLLVEPVAQNRQSPGTEMGYKPFASGDQSG